MNTLQWLNVQDEGFGNLPEIDRKEIMEFSLLWSFFEGRILDPKAKTTPNAIATLATRIADENKYQPEKLADAIAYWRDRYAHAGTFTYHYEHLHLRQNDNVAVVDAVLLGKDDSPISVLTCALTIVYRYRNNLFHGIKWAYQLRDQQLNFETASRVLIATAEMAKKTRQDEGLDLSN